MIAPVDPRKVLPSTRRCFAWEYILWCPDIIIVRKEGTVIDSLLSSWGLAFRRLASLYSCNPLSSYWLFREQGQPPRAPYADSARLSTQRPVAAPLPDSPSQAMSSEAVPAQPRFSQQHHPADSFRSI